MIKKLTTEEFINKAKEIHQNKYDYSKVEYINDLTNINIICPIHGMFYQTPNNHLSGKGCPECGKIKSSVNNKLSQEEVINKINSIDENYIIPSNFKYINSKEKIELICRKHGSFKISFDKLMNGERCKKCSIEKRSISKDDFIKKAKIIHSNKYNYNINNDIVKNSDKIHIICPIHGNFTQSARMHMRGQGCPKCKQSHIEKDIIELLENNKIIYEYQKKFKFIKNKIVDFYLPNYNVVIECQGEQHFRPIDFSGKMSTEALKQQFIKQEKRDSELYYDLIKNNILIIYYINLSRMKTTSIDILNKFYSDKKIFFNCYDILKYIMKLKYFQSSHYQFS